jgi:salicylate hydroxylase
MPPTGGLGASTAIIDAINLADQLAQDILPAAAISNYQTSMLKYAPGYVNEARQPLFWQRRFANSLVRRFAMSALLPGVNAALQLRKRIGKK